MDINTIYLYIEVFIGIASIAYPIYKILELHAKLSTKLDMLITYMSTHETRLTELEKLIVELSQKK
jgi:hypothetical protein